MKIQKVVITPIAFPDPPLLNASGVHQPWALRSIVEVDCGDGLIGLGETYGDSTHLALLRKVAPLLNGLDPVDTNGLSRAIHTAIQGGTGSTNTGFTTGPSSPRKTVLRVLSPFEVVFLDLQGQIIGRPIVDLLGGKVRDQVPLLSLFVL